MPFLSVIIPTYNSEKTIERCLNSIISQTYQDFEICIIDGASRDSTIAKVSNFRVDCDRIRIISEKDKGTYDAMNKSIDIALGEWIYFLGSDDEMYDENVFADVFNSIPAKNCGMIYGNVRINGDTSWAKDGQIYDGEFQVEQILARNICHQAIFYRKKIFDKLGKYNIRYPVCADWELNLRFFPSTNPRYLDRIIANFYGGGISSENVTDSIGDRLIFLRKKFVFEYNFYRLISSIGFT
jgi:glycosyltransferase involved in cell wall biosynthesis